MGNSVERVVAEMRERAQTSDDCQYGTISASLVREWADALASLRPTAAAVRWEHRIMCLIGERTGQWSLWGDIDRDQYEFLRGRDGHEVRALGVITNGDKANEDLLPRFKVACRALFRERKAYAEDLETMHDVLLMLERNARIEVAKAEAAIAIQVSAGLRKKDEAYAAQDSINRDEQGLA